MFSVQYNYNILIFTEFLSSKLKKLNREEKYELFAVTYHNGESAFNGHYVTDAFHEGYATWIRYDDSKVKCISESTVLKPESTSVPYLLYYRRCDTINH